MPPFQGYQGQPQGVRAAMDVPKRSLIQSDRRGVGQRLEGGLEIPGHQLREVLVFRVERHGPGGSRDSSQEGVQKGGGVEMITVSLALRPEEGQRVPGQRRLRWATGRGGSGAGEIVISGHGRLFLWGWERGGGRLDPGFRSVACTGSREAGRQVVGQRFRRGMHGKMVMGSCEEKGK